MDKDDIFGSLKDLFGDGKEFEDIKDLFGGSKGSEDKDRPNTRKDALLRTFTAEMDKGDFFYLEEIVVRYHPEVDEQSDAQLFRAHALASIYVDNLPVAYSSLTKLDNPSQREKELMGIVANLIERYAESIRYIHGTRMASPLSRIALSLSLYNQFQRDPGMHEEILQPLIDRSAAANTIVGVLYFNMPDLDKAEPYFTRAVQLSPNSLSIRLNELRTVYKRGMRQQVFAVLNSFYAETGCSLSADDLITELEKDEINLPELHVKGRLYDVARNLIG